jgi:hypothetical protein
MCVYIYVTELLISILIAVVIIIVVVVVIAHSKRFVLGVRGIGQIRR